MADGPTGGPSVRAGPGVRHEFSERPAHPPLIFVVAATLGVVGVPALAAMTLLTALRPRPAMAVVLGVSLGVALAASVVGQTIWARRPESLHFALWDLMAWNAVRRRQAERRVERKAHLLGFDLDGRFAGHVRVPVDQQLAVARDISRALEIKSTYSRNHSKRVERHARRLAAALGLSPEETEQLAIAAALHDIGNIKISEALLRKPGRLTPEEREAVEGHVLLGAAMAFSAGSPDVVAGVRHHHEHWDGSGYPSGLVGDEIPLFARIISIGASYEAMTSARSYRRPFTRDQALEIMRSQSGGQFDPYLLELFVSSLTEQRAAAFIPSVMAPVYATREFFRSLRRVRGGTAAALVAGGTAVVLLGTAIVAPGTFRMPSVPGGPDAVSIGKGSVDVELEGAETDADEEDPVIEEDEDAVAELVDVPGDVVLGTRFERDGGPRDPAPGSTPSDPGPDPGPGPGPGPGPDPDPTEPDPGGPAVDPDLPEPGVSLPGEGRKAKRKGKGHAYGHDHGPTHPGQIHGNGEGNGPKDKDNQGHGNGPDKGNAHGNAHGSGQHPNPGPPGHAPDVDLPAPPATPEGRGVGRDDDSRDWPLDPLLEEVGLK